jgi:alkylhydroperoxidase/carboxymuconolactone decarboxylase family protein YurZ
LSGAEEPRGRLGDETVRGWSRLRHVLDRDGALPRLEKAMLLTGVAATKGGDDLLERELAAFDAAERETLIPPCVSVLALARGRDIAARLAAAAGAPLVWPEPVLEPADPAEIEAALAYFSGSEGAAPFPVKLLSEHAPQALVAYQELRAGIYGQTAIEPRLIELLLFAISSAGYQPAHAAVHAAKAVEQDAELAELVEAGLCAVPAAGMPGWLFAAEAIAKASG